MPLLAAAALASLLLGASASAATSRPALSPVATIRLSGSAASGMAEANGALWVTQFESTVLSKVDPRIGAEVGTVEVGPNAASVTAIGGRLWIARYTNRPGDSRLVRMDPGTARITGRFQLPHLCCEVAGAAGRIWAIDPRGALLRIDPLSGRVAGKTAVALDPLTHMGLMSDGRSLWLSSDTTPLLKVNPATGRVVSRTDVGGGIPMTVSRGLVWGAGPHHVWAVHPASGEVRVRFDLQNTIETLSMAVTDDAIWVGARRPGYVGTVLRFDLTTHELTGEAPVSLPARILLAFGDIWIVDWDTDTLSRFEP